MCTPSRRIRRGLFYVGGNVLLFALTWVLIAGVGEVWLRFSQLPLYDPCGTDRQRAAGSIRLEAERTVTCALP